MLHETWSFLFTSWFASCSVVRNTHSFTEKARSSFITSSGFKRQGYIMLLQHWISKKCLCMYEKERSFFCNLLTMPEGREMQMKSVSIGLWHQLWQPAARLFCLGRNGLGRVAALLYPQLCHTKKQSKLVLFVCVCLCVCTCMCVCVWGGWL